MSKITWTNVDAVSRKILEDRGILPSGATDAEVALSLIGFLDRSLRASDENRFQLQASVDRLGRQLAAQCSPGKTKDRVSALEVALAELKDRIGFDV